MTIPRNLESGHRITRILQLLNISRSTYYDFTKWKPSKSAERRQLLKKQVLNCWLKQPMYGYLRITKYFKEKLNIQSVII